MRKITAAGTIVLALGLCIASLFIVYAVSPPGQRRAQKSYGWPVYGGPAGDHYCTLDQINRSNVHQLKVAWTFDTGEKGGLESSPLIIGSVLYTNTPSGKVMALNAAHMPPQRSSSAPPLETPETAVDEYGILRVRRNGTKLFILKQSCRLSARKALYGISQFSDGPNLGYIQWGV